MQDKKITVAGVGGGGVRIVDCMARLRQEDVVLAAIDTDARSLNFSKAAVKLQIGGTRTNGMGTGGDINLGRLAGEDDAEMIRGLLDNSALLFLTVALGGGTGTGTAPVVLQAARESGAVTFCVATLPFAFEGQKKRERAEQAVAALRELTDVLVVIPNEALFSLAGVSSAASSFEKTDDVLADALTSLWRLVTHPGIISLGISDLYKIARNCGGTCALGYGVAEGPDRVPKALAALFQSPLLSAGDTFASARLLLVSISGGQDLSVQEVGNAMKEINARKHPEAEVSMGTVVSPNAQGKLAITLIASEHWRAQDPGAAEPPPEVEEDPGTGKGKRGKGDGTARQRQQKLRLESAATDRFKDTNPSVFDGEDLDIPTFIRRRISIER